MKMNFFLTSAVLMTLSFTHAHAQQSVTTRRGGTASGSVTQTRNTATATGTATSARGKTVSGSATATKTLTGTTGSATVTGPKGATSTASGSVVSNGNGTNTVSGTRHWTARNHSQRLEDCHSQVRES